MQNGYALATDGAGGPDGYGYPPQNMNGDGNMQMGMGMPMGMGAGSGGGGVGAMPMPLSGRMPVAVGGVVQAGMEPRSPPSKQNTSHVPCKFFRQGACQAGKACPFSHDLASTNDNVCKYFSKGNCKFGPKCANAHILPNGTRVSYRNGQPVGIGMPALNLGGRVHPDPYGGSSASTLTNGLYRQNMAPPYYPQYGGGPEDFSRNNGGMDINGIPAIDTTYASERGSAYGSPRDDDLASRYGLGLSPVPKGLSVLDVPLPASFDSQGISHIARYGPIASSVPSKFGLDSHSPASSSGFGDTRERGGSALKNLYTSAYGNGSSEDAFDTLGSPSTNDEIPFGKRVMHSQRFSRTKIMSASLPKSGLTTRIDQDWDNDFTFEEDYLPDSLKELLTPGEKARRGSRNAVDDDHSNNGRPIWGSGAGTPVDALNGNGSGTNGGAKFGSPSQTTGTGSPSRWSPFFQKQAEEESKNRASAFGHVGSPLRNSLLGSSNIPAVSRSGESGSPYASSPIRSGLGMSIISQQMQRTRLSGQSGGNTSAPAIAPIGTPPKGGLMSRKDLSGERTTSGNSELRRVTSPIEESEEVEGDGVFRMEEEGSEGEKRNSGGGLNGGSGGWTMPSGQQRRGGEGMSGGGMEGMFGVNR